uniref:Conserved plasma membrane protein n=1 Tax=Caenorhabditis tropicalis TaxID=1561998 RepID=A0A1I7TT89_9PELO
MRIGNFSLKPKKEEEEPKALGYDFDDILEHFERDEIELDEKRKKFETCYVGMYLLYFIGHVIVSFLVFRQMEPLYYNSAIYQTYAAIVPVVLCSIAFKKSFKNLMKLRKANQRLSKLISHCYI